MADLGALVTIADKVFQVLQSPVLRDMNKWKSDLENLNNSVSFIKNMLLDADLKPELSHVEQGWVDELNEVLYEADDLFDEVITIAKMKELNTGAGFSKKVLDKVSRFFSSKNRILVSYNTSQEVKTIQRKLDAIARDHARYDFKVDPQVRRYEFTVNPQATLNRREDTCSYLDETHENIIGRDDDVNAVVDMLLDPNIEENLGFVVVVGIGGLGKTTLARLVYNLDRVKSRFEKNLWVCISDQNGKALDIQSILSNIIESSTNKKPSDVSTMQSMQKKFVLPNLVEIELKYCERLHGIPLLRNLKNLKFLSLYELNNLEFMEPSAISHVGPGSKDVPFFPSLEYLRIWKLKRLKGWWGGVNEGDSGSGMLHWQPPFPCLSTLIIDSCPNLISLPPCPSLELLEVKNSNKSLQILPGEGPGYLDLKLKVKEIDNVGYLTTLHARRLTHIMIKDDQEMKRLSGTEEVFRNSSSLRSLVINGCPGLTSISGALEHLTALESLSLIYIPPLVDDPDDMPWRFLRHSLISLELESLDMLQALPTGMKHLTSLQNLSISYCYSLKGLPEWIDCLSSLRSLMINSCPDLNSLGTIQNITSLLKLDILDCPDLTEACHEPSGREKIRHILHISISDRSIYK